MGNIGIWQILLVLVIILILFGAGKLPKVMGDFAKGIRNFKSGLKDESEDQETAEPKVLREQGQPAAPAPQAAAAKQEDVVQR